jgi:hypothetical protein
LVWIGLAPTGIGVPSVRVAKSIGVTEPEPSSATYALLPSGVIATANGSLRLGSMIGVPAVFVARSIGTTV